jgi:release factor glutamine methyltransferase
MDHQQQKQVRWHIKDVLQWTASYLKTKGISTARLDSEVLLAHCLGVDRLHLYLNLERPLTAEERLRYRELVRRRALREPVSLIIGRKEFWSLQFRVESGVLVPRPDTEIIVETILKVVQNIVSPSILEIGTGSGAISIAVAREKPLARMFATDIDLKAAKLAAYNARNLQTEISFMVADLFSAIKRGALFDVVCSNPPYIPDEILPTLDPEINYEPWTALKGGPDGLDVIRKIILEAPNFLAPGALLVLEMGSDQEDAVRGLMEDAGFKSIESIQDLSGKPRVVKGQVLS